MEIVEIDHLGPQSLQALIRDFLRVLRRPVQANHSIGTGLSFRRDLESEFGGDNNSVADALQRFSEQDLVFMGSIHFGGVEQRDAEFDCAAESGNRFRLGLPAIRMAHAHASQADSGNVEFSEAPRFHSDFLLHQLHLMLDAKKALCYP